MGLASSRQRELRESLVDGGAVYNFPGDRQKKRRSRNYPTDSDGVQFDPTCDKYDFLLVFPRPDDDESEAEGDRISWCQIETLWFQAIPGDEDRKTAGIEWLRQEWVSRFRTDTVSSAEGGDTVPLTALQGLVREHVVDRLTKAGLQLELTLAQDGSKVFCRVRAPMALLERKADELNHKLKFRGEVDPGPEFWRKSADQDAEGKPIFCEIVEESILYEKNQANELLEDLYRAGKVGPNDAAVFDEAEPTKKHWSRRVHTLERIADRVPVTNRFPAHADFTTAPESRHLYDEYPSVRGKTPFLPKDRLYLTSKIMDEHFDFGVLVEHKVVEQCLALHDANAGESLTLEWFSDHWVLFWRSGPRDCGAPRVSMPQIDKGEACQYWERPWAQPLMEIRAYFGEQVALYFAWLGYYGYSLTTPTIVLTAAGIYEFVTGQSADDEGWWKPVQVSLAFFLVAWSALYKDGWDVEQQWCATKWGMLEFEEEEADRPQFVGDADEPRRLSPITNQNETYYPAEKRARTQFFNSIIVALLALLILVIFALIFELEYKLLDVLPASLAGYVLPLLIAILIQWFSRLYNPIAYYLNESENYQTQTNYDNNLVLKVFAFEIMNNYSSLALTAFFKGWYWGCISGDDNCLSDLKRLTGVIFGVRFALALWGIVGGGCISRSYKAFLKLVLPEADTNEDNDGENPMHDDVEEGDRLKALEHPAFVDEAELEEYEGLFDDYAEIVLQMGLVCMWSLGFYYMPLLAALEILLQMRVDAYGLVCDSQRPTPTPAETVGSWGTLMDTMSLLAVFTNAGIIVYTTKSLEDWSSNEKLCAFFVVEQLLLLTKALAHLCSTGVPTRLEEIQKRQEHVVDRHKHCRFEEVFEDDEDEVAGLKRGHVDRSEVRERSQSTTDGMSPFTRSRIAYLDEKLRACESDVTIARSQYRVACKTEVFNEDCGVSYSRRTPGLALGMVTLTVLEAENVGQRHDPVNASSCRAVVHVRDPTPRHQRAYEGPPGPAPQVSKPAKKPPRSNELPEDLRSAGARMVFNQTFSLAPVKTSKAEIFIEIMDHAKRLKRGSTTIALSDLSDQRKQALTLSILRPTATTTAQFGIPQEAAVLYVKAQFQYSRILPIKRRIYRLLEGRRKITQDRQNLRLGKAPEHQWDFPDDPSRPDPGATPTATPSSTRVGFAPAPAPFAPPPPPDGDDGSPLT